jgi:hypothetical protein
MDKLMDSDDETMFVALVEEEAEIAAADDEEHLMQSRGDEGRRLDATRASRGRG